MTRPSPVMLGMLRDFCRAPAKARAEIGDTTGHVLRAAVEHCDARRFGALVSRGWIDYLKRCACEGPCGCRGNGWHVTESGLTAAGKGCAK